MRSVNIKAINIQRGDIINGERVKTIVFYPWKPRKTDSFAHDPDASHGVLIVTPNPDGYDLKVRKFRGNRKIVVKRPIKNMKHRAILKRIRQAVLAR